VPLIGWLFALMISLVIWLWQIAAMVVAVRQVLDYSTTGKAVAVVLIGFVINLVIMFVIMVPVFGARLLYG